jgi:hypothetical protein
VLWSTCRLEVHRRTVPNHLCPSSGRRDILPSTLSSPRDFRRHVRTRGRGPAMAASKYLHAGN